MNSILYILEGTPMNEQDERIRTSYSQLLYMLLEFYECRYIVF